MGGEVTCQPKTRKEMMEQTKHPIVYTEEMGDAAVKKIEGCGVIGPEASKIWKPIASSPSIGNCDEMCQMIFGAFIEKYNRLPTDQEYLDAQIAYAESKKYNQYTIWSRGRTVKEYWALAEYYRTEIKSIFPKADCTLEDCLYAILSHVVTQTMRGKIAEKELADKIISKYTNSEMRGIEYPSGSEDALYGVDMIAYFGKNHDKYGIQVKPVTFFKGAYSERKKDNKEDSDNLIEKNFSAIEHFGLVGMLYAIYQRGNGYEFKWFYKEDKGRKKFLFTIEELYDVDTRKLICFNNGRIKFAKCAI